MIMKKLTFFILSAFLLFALVSCGPSKKEKESALEKASQDSINAAVEAQRQADSFAAYSGPELAKDVNLNTKTPKDKKFIKTAEVKFKVNNVWKVTERIEDITAKYGGFVTHSNLKNRDNNYASRRVSRDSILICKQIVVENHIELRVPNESLDSLVRELNKFIIFLDYRIINLDDATYFYALTQKKTETLQTYQQHQTKHIDTKDSKLKETTRAEETLLDSKLASDELQVQKLALDDQLKYCTLTINIYQKPLIVRETIANFSYVSSYKPNIFKRLGDSLIQGWWILEEIIVFLVQMWGVILLIVGVIVGYKLIRRWYLKTK
jgi:hypothetical protein